MADAGRLAAALADRYRIEREIGAGGMATVYLAFDIKHDRRVALKVLKPELAAVLGADRFVIEIKTTAALQHPHILPLYDSGTADGFLFYVMPFIDGETLRAKLDRETQLGIDEAVRIASNVADALDYAHRHGVIHRDIKPENILLHEGRPMVADFGIALAVSAAAGGRMTETGLSLGTPHYMSPEQATAEKEISARSDIYSLASVLYEMLAGQPPHTGGSAQQIIMKIITETAPPVTTLRKSVPNNVARAVATSLEKLPADRFESARDFAAALANPAYAGSATANRVATDTENRRWRGLALAASAVAFLLLFPAFHNVVLRPGAADAARPWLVRIILPDSAPVGSGMSLSADGSVLVYDGGGRIWMRTADASDVVPIAGTEGGRYPVISPDGRNVAFIRNNTLSVLPLDGGAPRIVPTRSSIGSSFAWLDDDNIILPDLTGLMRVPVGGGDVQPLTVIDTAAGEVLHVQASGLPDGRGAVFMIAMRNTDSSVIAVAGPDGGPVTRLLPGVGAIYAPPGYLIVTRSDGTIAAVPFDTKRRRLTGSAITIASGLNAGGFSTVGRATASANGRLVYVASGWGMTNEPADLVWIGRNGVTTPVDTGWTGAFQSVSLSKDGRRVAAGLYSNRTEELQVRELSSGSLSRVLIQGTQLRDPAFAADGLLYFVGLGASRGVHRVNPGGTALPERVVTGEFVQIGHPALTPAGDHLYWFTTTAGSRQIIRHDVSNRTGVGTGIGGHRPQVSPDGNWLSFITTAAGQPEVHVRSTDAARAEDWRVAPLVNGLSAVRWSYSGDELFYIAGDSMMAVRVATSPSFSAGAPRALFSTTGLQPVFDVHRDGRFLMIRLRPDVRPRTELVMLERWTELLRR